MKEYTPKELKEFDARLYYGACKSFEAAVPTFVENIFNVLGTMGGGMCEHGSFMRMTDYDDSVIYMRIDGAFIRKEDEMYFGMTKIVFYDTALEYDLARIETTERTKSEYGENIHGVPTTTDMDGMKIIDERDEPILPT